MAMESTGPLQKWDGHRNEGQGEGNGAEKEWGRGTSKAVGWGFPSLPHTHKDSPKEQAWVQTTQDEPTTATH